MPSFDKDFMNAKGAPIKYKDLELIRIDRIPVKKKFSGYLRIISTNSEWKQGIRIKVDGLMTINACEGNDFIIWADDVKGDIPFKGTSKKSQLMIWNAWDTGSGRVDAWLNGAAMILELSGSTRRYKCNDSHPDENFDDIIFEVILNE
ncbi:MAG: hypothetical protein KBA11_10800 [Sedimentibacter sp.]|nr:hypothetical protein [Sedimentibacter sp.]